MNFDMLYDIVSDICNDKNFDIKCLDAEQLKNMRLEDYCILLEHNMTSPHMPMLITERKAVDKYSNDIQNAEIYPYLLYLINCKNRGTK